MRKTLAEIAELVAGTLEGDGSFVVTGAAGLQEAGPEDISFLGNPKYAASAQASNAGCLLLPAPGVSGAGVPPRPERESGLPAPGVCPPGRGAGAPGKAKNRIFVEDPQYAFSQVLWLIHDERPKPPPVIDSKACVHYQARLGPGVSVGPFAVVDRGSLVAEGAVIGAQCYVGENVRIGRYCLLHPRVVIREDCVIGDRVIVQPGAVIGGDGYGFSTDKKTGRHRKIPQIGNVVVGDDVEIGANAAIDRATTGSTVIGPGTKIDNLVQLGHNVKTGKDCLIVAQTGVSGSTTLGERVILAGQAGLVGHIKIGDGAIVTAKTGVMHDIPKGEVHFGIPSRPHREAMKLQALFGRLPDIHDAVKAIKKKLGLHEDHAKVREG
ncbi:MAG: UDP-3-O-(3-hydroxymyristoyl)glucosamine N-acyltransferase [Elusimicrobia bacterium]|nr:UDP-3-O-(3-hydroxymyristoyl)glucosamine N-acyltransferase [Elusimicrobiota bacterium]